VCTATQQVMCTDSSIVTGPDDERIGVLNLGSARQLVAAPGRPEDPDGLLMNATVAPRRPPKAIDEVGQVGPSVDCAGAVCGHAEHP
jgi:hypothetical protein